MSAKLRRKKILLSKAIYHLKDSVTAKSEWLLLNTKWAIFQLYHSDYIQWNDDDFDHIHPWHGVVIEFNKMADISSEA